MSEYKKLLPLDGDLSWSPPPDWRTPLGTKEFWEWCKKHELRIQRCKDCGTYRHPPRPMCANCNSMDTEWAKVSGKAKVWSWSTVYRSYGPGFEDEAPYSVVYVELDEGVRMTTNVIDVKPEEFYYGMPVEVIFEDVTEAIALFKFKRAS